MEKIFDVMGCEDAFKTRLTVYKFEGNALALHVEYSYYCINNIKAFWLLHCYIFISLLSFLIIKVQNPTVSPNEHYALWKVIEFGDSYKAPPEEAGKGPASESSARKKGRTVAITTEDMQKRKNDVKVRTTLLLALPDE
uniref:Uncharacterized protein n=1 Tax=Tanacetum cinerariifolium TaxID=118510 RepID=A0A699QJQ9_TANCI|nr:hypothetical protein [Tanacetum cinerariifolium]